MLLRVHRTLRIAQTARFLEACVVAGLNVLVSQSTRRQDGASGVNRVAGSRVIGAQAMERNLT